MDLAEDGMTIEVPKATVVWKSEKRGPYSGRDGVLFYTISIGISDGTIKGTYIDRDGNEKETTSIFVSFPYREYVDKIEKGSLISCKIKYGTYNGKPSIKGSYLRTILPERKPSKNNEYKILMKEVIDPLFNIMWNALDLQAQREIMGKNKSLIDRLNKYLE